MLKIFLGVEIRRSFLKELLLLGPFDFLFSYAIAKNRKRFPGFCADAQAILGQPPKVFFDSGAFTEAEQGIEVDLQKHISFVKAHEPRLSIYANLDVISDPENTWANQAEMEAHGLAPLPTYHYEESWKYFDKALQYKYFAIGGLKGQQKNQIFFDQVFARICPAANGYMPTHKVHGFGVTSFPMMRRYPWYSVDSSTWAREAVHGTVFVPRRVNGEFSYEVDPMRLCISSRNPRSGKRGQHFLTLIKEERFIIEEYFEAKGFKVGKSSFSGGKEIKEELGLCNDRETRLKANAIYFFDFARSRPEWPWPFK